MSYLELGATVDMLKDRIEVKTRYSKQSVCKLHVHAIIVCDSDDSVLSTWDWWIRSLDLITLR